MVDIVQLYKLLKHIKRGKPYNPVKAIKCADGFIISVQASMFNYCMPRDDKSPWTHVELGFPNQPIPSLFEYMDGGEDRNKMNTVWGNVPIEKVLTLLEQHGGWNETVNLD